MGKVLLATFCITFVVIACEGKCVIPSVGLPVDKKAISGKWYGQEIYGPPKVGDGTCFLTQWSVTDDDKLDVLDSWKDKRGKWQSLDCPELKSESKDGVTSYTFKIREESVTFWFLLLNHHSMAAYSCDEKTQTANVYIMSREQPRDNVRVKEVVEHVGKMVAIPEDRHVIDQASC
ncbi:unnamed protein product [Callosobruchus maculatus]|uniref:Lipocalin/cytosolic fatty-acid binding domain-containing protein n=1 Tax=Callosobruchus maculatus TaxID=64391 RepID=A0A653CIC6_CALMS|nr:unnamed protein product [Callosobruchus maculatus]